MKDKVRKSVPTKEKKLNLNMKTVRILNEKELRGVAGGEPVTGGGPPPTSPAAGSGGCGG